MMSCEVSVRSSVNIMNALQLIFVFVAICPIIGHANGQDENLCKKNCVALEERLEKIDCSAGVRETASFLKKNRYLVADFSRQITSNRSKIQSLSVALNTHSKTMTDCFIKYRTKNGMDRVQFAVMKIDSGIAYWRDKPEAPEQVQKILLEDYDLAVNVTSLTSAAWKP